MEFITASHRVLHVQRFDPRGFESTYPFLAEPVALAVFEHTTTEYNVFSVVEFPAFIEGEQYHGHLPNLASFRTDNRRLGATANLKRCLVRKIRG